MIPAPEALVPPSSSPCSYYGGRGAGGPPPSFSLLSCQHIGDEIPALSEGPAVSRVLEWTPRHTSQGRRPGLHPLGKTRASTPDGIAGPLPANGKAGSIIKLGDTIPCFLLAPNRGGGWFRRNRDTAEEKTGGFCEKWVISILEPRWNANQGQMRPRNIQD